MECQSSLAVLFSRLNNFFSLPWWSGHKQLCEVYFFSILIFPGRFCIIDWCHCQSWETLFGWPSLPSGCSLHPCDRESEDQSHLLLFSLLSGFPFQTTHAVQRTIDFCASGWLNVLPLLTIIFIVGTAIPWHPLLATITHCLWCLLCVMGVEEILVWFMHWIVIRFVHSGP